LEEILRNAFKAGKTPAQVLREVLSSQNKNNKKKKPGKKKR
jgi:hypothetical protein